MRITGLAHVALVAACCSIRAQVIEPILTRSANPFPSGAGDVKLDYAGGIGQEGGNSQIIPEGTLEMGFGGGWEALARFPLLRVNLQPQHDTVIGGGQLAMGARYLITGGGSQTYSISAEAVVEAPTGNTRLVGDATQVMPAVLADWHPANRIAIYSNLTFDHSIGGAGSSTSLLEYKTAIAWRAAVHSVPALEFAGSTNAITGRTEAVILPELIFLTGRNLEWKAGLQLGLNAATPRLGLRIQFAWSWGTNRPISRVNPAGDP